MKISNGVTKKIKIIIPVIIILLVLIAGGIFWWWQWTNEEYPQPKTISKNVYISSAEYEIKETPEGKILENKKEGFTAKIPESWIVKKDEEGIGIFSPDIEFDEYGGFLKSVREKGACVIGIEIFKSVKVDPELTIYAEDLRNLIEQAQQNPVGEETIKSEVATVSNKLGLKTIYFREGKEKYITVEIPVNHTVYSFNSGLIFSEKCLQEFNKILETVTIE